MALTAGTAVASTRPAARLPGPDVVRAVALVGVVVMNYHGYLVLKSLADGGPDGDATGEGWAADLFDPWDGPLSTRFAATFVLVAGVGVTLLTSKVVNDPSGDRVTVMRWRLVRRGVLLYAGGLLLDEIWPGTIIPFYGAMFVLAAGVFTWRGRWIALVGTLAVVAGSSIRLWRFERERAGHSTSWLTSPDGGSVRGYVFDVFVNGTHPLLPWFGFLCAGILLGRVLRTEWWRPAALGTGLALFVGANAMEASATTRFQDVLFSTDSGDRGAIYAASALGTALIAYAAIDALAVRFPHATDPLRRAGQMTLTLYLAHVLVFNLVVDWLGWIEPAGLDVALLFALGFWVAGLLAAAAWQRRFGRGPAEVVYRAFGG